MMKKEISMNKALYGALVGAAMLGLAGAASAQQPVQLTNAQLDHVTAGATSTTLFGGLALGNLGSAVVVTAANAVAGTSAAAAADVTSIATSTIPGPGATAASGLVVTLTSP
jgi:hypothetical protein